MIGPVTEDAKAIVVPPVVWHAALANAIDPANDADDTQLAALIPPPDLPAPDPQPLDDDLVAEPEPEMEPWSVTEIEGWPDDALDPDPEQD